MNVLLTVDLRGAMFRLLNCFCDFAGLKEENISRWGTQSSQRLQIKRFNTVNMRMFFVVIPFATGLRCGVALFGRSPRLFIPIVLFACFALGCAGPVVNPMPDQMVAPTPVNLVAGDVIKLTFSGAQEFNQSQKIRADGKINLPLIGEVDAAGKTIASLQNEISLRYKPQLQNTSVVVTLESSVVQVVVSGAVSKPSKLSFDRPTTVFQAIMEAGGVGEFGTLKRVHLIRIKNGEQHTQILDLRPTMSGKTTRAFYVRDGDVIYVPQSAF